MARSSGMRALVLAAALLGAASAASAACVVPLEMAPESTLTLGGSVIKPFRMRLTPTSVSKSSGVVSVVFAGACPTAASLGAALRTATLKRTPGSAFRIEPLTARIMTMVFVDVADFEGHLVSTGAVAEDGSVPVTLSVTKGDVTVRTRSKTVVTPLAGREIEGAGCSLSASPEVAGRIELNCPTVMFSQMIEDKTEGVVLKAEATGTVTAAGSLSARRMVAAEEMPELEQQPEQQEQQEVAAEEGA